MAQQKRVQQKSEFGPEQTMRDDNVVAEKKQPKLRIIVNEKFDEHAQKVTEFENEFGEMPSEVRKLRLDKVRIFHRYVKMLDAFKSDYRKELKHMGAEPSIFVLDSENHAEVNFVFKNADITNLVESKQEADYRERLGVPAEKFNPKTQLTDEPVDIMIALYDTDADTSWKFERNIKRGGLLLCRAKLAKELLESTTDFEFMGTLKEGGGLRHSERSKRTDYWEHAVKTDAEFEAASKKNKPGSPVITYQEAIDTMRAAKWPTGEKSNRVLKNYQALIETARKDPNSKINEEKGTITYKDPAMDEPVELKTEFPFGIVDNRLGFILRKRREGEQR